MNFGISEDYPRILRGLAASIVPGLADLCVVYWIDPAKKTQLAADMKAGKAYPLDPNIDKDFYGVRIRFAT